MGRTETVGQAIIVMMVRGFNFQQTTRQNAPPGECGVDEEPVASDAIAIDTEDLVRSVTDAASRVHLMEIWGRWPGDETIEELLAALEESC